MALAALSRWPNLLWPNFSAFYGLAFCAGAFFPRRIRWWMPLATLMVSDLALNLYYRFSFGTPLFSWSELVKYAAFLLIVLLGTRFSPRSSFAGLLSGGILGAVLFYLITNTASWLQLPAYTKDLAGWIRALTRGTDGYPTTLQFFFNTLLSGGLFTGLFAGACKWSAAAESPREKEPVADPAPADTEESPEPGEA